MSNNERRYHPYCHADIIMLASKKTADSSKMTLSRTQQWARKRGRSNHLLHPHTPEPIWQYRISNWEVVGLWFSGRGATYRFFRNFFKTRRIKHLRVSKNKFFNLKRYTEYYYITTTNIRKVTNFCKCIPIINK